MDNLMLNNLLQKQNCVEVSPIDFYRHLFPIGSFEAKGNYEDRKPNGIIIEVTGDKKPNGKDLVFRHTLTDDLEKIDEVCSRSNFCLMSPIGYISKNRKNENAREIYAIAIDIDGIDTEQQVEFLMRQCSDGHNMRAFIWGLPKPTYIVCSGSGVHLYYVFEKAVLTFPHVVKELEKLKKRLTWQAWTQGASSLSKKIQYESIFQGFRVAGTKTKKGDIARVYKYGLGEKLSINDLNYYVPEEYRATNLKYKSNLSLAEAKEKYPQWYQSRIVYKKPKGTWTCKVDLYNWWIKKIQAGAEQGHRYWSIMTLATYAIKCNVPYEKLVEDSLALREELERRGDKFTVEEVMRALEAYNSNYITYPIHTIAERTGIPIERNKRNGRSQAKHLQNDFWENEKGRPSVNVCKQNRELTLQFMRVNGEIPGRPSAEQAVFEWQKSHPEGRKCDCIRDTGLTKPTVYKWWLPKEKLEEKLSREYFQREASQYIFTESEMTPAFIEALSRNGIRSVNVVPDDEYENALAQGFGAWLQTQKN